MGLDQGLQSLGPDERSVAAENHDLVTLPAGSFRAEHGMTGSELFFLDNRSVGVLFYGGKNSISLVADNNNSLFDSSLFHRIQHMVEHGFEKNLVQDLGPA